MTRLAAGSKALASEERRRQVVAHYERQLKQHGATARGMDWKDAESQRLRFEMLSEGLDLAGSSVHDVGAGAGHFYDYLLERAIDVRYSGSDLSGEMIEAARRRHPDAAFECRDVLDASNPERYDFVFCSGLFNVKLDCPESAWQRFVESAVLRMYEMCTVAISFNLMSDRVDYRAEGLYYSDPDAMAEFCRSRLSPDVAVRHDYPLYEYTIHVRR
jgi:SAM-dependent methyltransferase